MSVRTYIGARYVPLFADPLTWDPTQTYEPLTVVLYQGNSYTSRQAVPANIDISNQTYWAQTGNYNAQVEQYRQEVQTFDGRITQNATDISDEETARTNADTALSERITANATAISNEATARGDADTALSGRITANSTAISSEASSRASADADLNARIDTLEEAHYMVIVGDSWSQHSYPAENLMWWNIVARALHLTPYNAAVGGTGFCVGNPTFYQQLTNAANALQGKIVDRVIVFGGMNDFGNHIIRTTFGDAVGSCMAHARTLFPNAYISVAGIAPHFMYNQYFNNAIPDYDGVGHMSSLLQFMGVGVGKADDYIDARFFGLYDLGFYGANQDHPSARGHADIACRMLGGNDNVWEVHAHNANADPYLELPDGTIITAPFNIHPCGVNQASVNVYFSIPSDKRGQTGKWHLYSKGMPPIPVWALITSQTTGESTGLTRDTVTDFNGDNNTQYSCKYSFNMGMGDMATSSGLFIEYTVNV